MKFRSRLLVGFLLGALIPMIALALVVRHEMTTRLTAQSEARVESLLHVIEGAIARRGEAVHAALSQVRDATAADNRFRRAVVDSEGDRRFLLDYAGNAMRLSGLSMLQIQDDKGRIVSSGHFRNDYDRLEPELPRFLNSLGGHVALVRARTAGDPLMVLASIDTVRVGRTPFILVGGIESTVLDELTKGSRLQVNLVLPGDTTAVADSTLAVVRRFPMPYFDTETHTYRMAALRVTSDLSELRELRHSIDRWFLIATGLAALAIILLAIAIASSISRPVVALAEQTAHLDLDRLDLDVDTDRRDEVGTLARGLQTMTTRLRESTARLKDAERRATLGDVARQVNHDIKNGLTPIRNAFRHLTQHVDDAGQLQSALRERQPSMNESIAYLESLATNYAKLSRHGARQRCDVNDIAKKVADGARGLAHVETRLDRGAFVDADPLALRRIMENLVDNAIDSLTGPDGKVTIETKLAGSRVHLVVVDTGSGMSDEQRAHIFDDFYTTKTDGSGLGLSIVRRLVMDMEGTINVESTPGEGSRFTVDLPASKGGD